MRRAKQASESHWVSLSDVMTGLMVIFLFIAVAYMKRVKEVIDMTEVVLDETVAVRQKLLRELNDEFSADLKRWHMSIDDDLSIKFQTVGKDVLFQTNSSKLEADYRERLSQFLPRYFDILRKPEYRDRILEVRVEGHTDAKKIARTDRYLGNLDLSQERAASVVRFFRTSDYFTSFDTDEVNHWNYRLTANGLSYGRMLNRDGQLVSEYGGTPDDDASRRVEFRVVTRDLEVIHAALDKLRGEDGLSPKPTATSEASLISN